MLLYDSHVHDDVVADREATVVRLLCHEVINKSTINNYEWRVKRVEQ